MEKSWRTSATTSISSRELAMRFSRSFSIISRWIPTILFLSWGTQFCFDLHAQCHAPNRNRKKVWPLERQKIRFCDEVSRFAWPWWLSPPYLFEFHLWSMMCLGILRRKHLKRCSFRRERWPRRNEGAKVGFEKEGTARY